MQAVLQLLRQAAGAAAPQTEADVVGHAQVGIEGVALEHHRHIPLGGPQTADGPIGHEDLATAGRLQPGQQPQQGALAAARGPHQHQELAVVDLQIELAQHLHGRAAGLAALARRVGLADLLKANLGQTGSATRRS